MVLEEVLRIIESLLEHEKRCSLATCFEDNPHLSLMLFTYLKDEGLVILSSRTETTKIRNIANNSRVALLFYNLGDGKTTSVSCTVHGEAVILKPEDNRHYLEAHLDKHRDMENFISGKDVVLIVVKIKHAALADRDDNVQTWSV